MATGRSPGALLVACAACLVVSASGQEKEEPTSRPTSQPASKPGSDPEGTDQNGGEKAGKAPDLVEPPPALAKHLKGFDREAEPRRELKRAFVSVVHYLLSRDLKRLLPYFHPKLRFHTGGGDFQPLPPKELRRMLEESLADEGRGAAPKLPKLDEALDLKSIRIYSPSEARKVDAEKAGWKKVEPARVASVMEKGDWLVLARLDVSDMPKEVFYVFRRDGPRLKVIVAE